MWKKTNVPSTFCATGADKGGGGARPSPEIGFTRKFLAAPLPNGRAKFFFVKIEGLSSFT